MSFDWQPVLLSFKLAGLTTLLLLILGTPIAWWLARSRAWYKQMIASVWRCRWCCRRP
jgi:molybdate transport system permease protein